MKTSLLQNEQIAQASVIPSKTATLWVAVLRGNPSPFWENGLPHQSADWLAMTGFQQNVSFATGPPFIGVSTGIRLAVEREPRGHQNSCQFSLIAIVPQHGFFLRVGEKAAFHQHRRTSDMVHQIYSVRDLFALPAVFRLQDRPDGVLDVPRQLLRTVCGSVKRLSTVISAVWIGILMNAY